MKAGPRPLVIGMFPGWAESVLWLDGDLPYDDLDLPADLVAHLRQWDHHWSKSGRPGAAGMRRRDRRRHDREGRRLARQVAQAFGDGVVIELRPTRRLRARRRYRGHGAGTAPRAAAVARGRHAEEADLRAHLLRLQAEGGELGWRALPEGGTDSGPGD